MDKNEWYKVGEDIKRQVQSAIDSNDFSELSKTISATVGQAVGDVGKSLNGAFHEVRDSFQQSVQKPDGMGTGSTYNSNYGQYNQPNMVQPKQKPYRGDVYYGKPNLRPDAKLFDRHPVGSISGVVYMALGYTALGIAGITSLVFMMLVLAGFFSVGSLIPTTIIAVLGLWIGVHGTKLKGRANRFQRYVSMVKDKLYCSIEELAQKTGRSQRFVRKDLKKMMQKGMFLQAHLDKQEKCFIASDAMYEQYMLTQKQYEEQKQNEKLNAKNKENVSQEAGQVNAEYQKVLSEGKEYVRMIRLCNDEIPGEEMSGKLDKLELLVTRIFAQVEKEPELAPELHKMLNYYLPTTQKLLEAYRDLDKQNVEVKNISETKKEIENTVDTINAAFEKFLDELFREKAWDIQSDISVLNTMLKQDGYLKNDFEG